MGAQSGGAADGRTFERHNPVAGGVATRAAAASPADARAACDAAAAAFPAWSELGPNARRAMLSKAADALAGLADQFVSAMCEEIGATEGWARFNVMLASGMLREAAAMTTQIGGEVIPSDKPGCIAMATRQPVGVVLGIAPWNAPVILGVRAVALPLACGNTVVLKASETCPRTHHLIGQAMMAAGFPPGVVNVITNAPEDASDVVSAMVAHPAVRRVNFTGSTHVGRIIAKLCAEHLKPVLLELGGKAPFIVLEDADLDEAVKAAAFGAFMNQGQICMSTEKIIVVDAIADQFVDKFAAKAKTLVAGDPRAAKTPLGAVVDLASVEKVQALIADAVGKGAKQVSGDPAQGVLMGATVVDGVTPEMTIYTQESFGPVVSVVRAKDE
ncbi:MAG: salicylaldehyde dehydrogenase, partial [Caulobacterales bacterium 68-7]